MDVFKYWFHMLNSLALIKREFETTEELKIRINKGTTGKNQNRWMESRITGDKRPTDLHTDPPKMSTSP